MAQEFAAVLLEQVLQQMRRANAAWGGEQQGLSRDVYAAWWDRELALAMVQGGGAGLAGALEQQLIRQYGR